MNDRKTYEDWLGDAGYESDNGEPLEANLANLSEDHTFWPERKERDPRLDKILKAMKTLSAREAEVVTLVAKGFRIVDVAEFLKIPKQSVNTLLNRAREKILLEIKE